MISLRQYAKPKVLINIMQYAVQSKRCARAVKGVQKCFREKLPQYRVDLRNLPPLTEHLLDLESKDTPGDIRTRRMNKLQTYIAYMPLDVSKVLLEALFNPDTNDIDQLLRLIDDNLASMTSFYLAVSFEVLDDMIRDKLCHYSTVAVAPEFKNLCTRTLYKLRFFEADEVLKVMKCLSTVKISEDTLIFQSTLKMARELINDLDPQELDVLLEILPSKQLLGLPEKCEKIKSE